MLKSNYTELHRGIQEIHRETASGALWVEVIFKFMKAKK